MKAVFSLRRAEIFVLKFYHNGKWRELEFVRREDPKLQTLLAKMKINGTGYQLIRAWRPSIFDYVREAEVLFLNQKVKLWLVALLGIVSYVGVFAVIRHLL